MILIVSTYRFRYRLYLKGQDFIVGWVAPCNKGLFYLPFQSVCILQSERRRKLWKIGISWPRAKLLTSSVSQVKDFRHNGWQPSWKTRKKCAWRKQKEICFSGVFKSVCRPYGNNPYHCGNRFNVFGKCWKHNRNFCGITLNAILGTVQHARQKSHLKALNRFRHPRQR